MSFKVLVPRTVAPEGIEYLKEHGCEVEVRTQMTGWEIKEEIKNMMLCFSVRM